MKKILLAALLFISFQKTNAQTSPAAYDLSSGTYSFTNWDSTASVNPALSYPSNMIFHTLGDQNPDENTPANGDWACSYDLQSGCWIKGMAAEGVTFKNIGNSQSPSCMVNGTGANIYVGDATVALNTTGCENISVSWIGRMLSNFTYADSVPITRFYSIACQYRLGSSGAFTNVPGNYLFKCNSDSVTYKVFGTADTMVTLLPDTCNNEALVELRWVYHQTAQNAGGPRPNLGIDDINITRDIVTNSTTLKNDVKPLYLFPNPVCNAKVTLNKFTNFVVLDVLGHTVYKSVYANEFSTDHLSKGIYFVKSSNGEIVKFIKQ